MSNAVAVLMAAYLFGSVPTALILSHMMGRGDLRLLGDGNMGARNATHVLGWGAGAVVAGVDFSKGALAVALARQLNSAVPLQLAAGVAAVLGHDFPIWAGFRGGQGMATSLGVLSMLMPEPTLWGLGAFAGVYLVTHIFDLSAGCGLGLLVFLRLARRRTDRLGRLCRSALRFDPLQEVDRPAASASPGALIHAPR